MKPFATSLLIWGILLHLAACQQTDQQSDTSVMGYQPEDVLTTVGQYELKYKHILAYINMEMDGEDPALLNDQNFLTELTAEGITEFGEDPASFIADMEVHYEAMMANAQSNVQQQQNISPNTNTGGGSWKQLLTGALLYQTSTQSGAGFFVQTTQYIHLCPSGMAYFYQNSGGGGGAITAPQQLEFTGSSQWNVVEQGGQAYLQMTVDGQTGNLLMQRVNDKIVIQALGALSIQPGGAQCP